MLKRASKQFLLVFSLSCFTPALAQTVPEFVMPDATAWLADTHRVVTGYGLHTAIENLAWALFLMLFAFGLLRATYYAQSSEVYALVGRLMLVGAVLIGTPEIRTATQNAWIGAYNWSNSVWATRLNDELATASSQAALLAGPFMGVTGILRYGAQRLAQRASQGIFGRVAGQASSSIASRALSYMNWIMLLFVPLLGLYAALIYISGLTVLLALVFLPLAAVLLMLPGGASWISRWVGMLAGALFTVIFLPIVFGIAINVGMVQPFERMGSYMQQSMDQFNTGLGALSPPSGSDFWKPAEWNEWLSNLGASFNLLGSIGTFFMGWLLSLVALVAGMLIGAYLLKNMERYLTGFVGSISGGGALDRHYGRGGWLMSPRTDGSGARAGSGPSAGQLSSGRHVSSSSGNPPLPSPGGTRANSSPRGP